MSVRQHTINRRQFIGTAAGALAGMTLGAKSRAADNAPHGANQRPNIVVIMADDMGFSDIGCYGSEIATPNLDGLARDGIRFTQAYNAARCCPSRASLLTGLYPHQAGMGDMVSRADKPRPAGPYQGYLNNNCVTIAEVLRSVGYRTYMAGKWHVGEAPDHWPRKRGFDRYFGLISGGSSYFELLPEEKPPRVMACDDEPFVPQGDRFYMTDAFTDYAVKYIEEHKEAAAPFFLYLAYTAPHWPLHAWPEDIAKYRGKYLIGWDRLREQRYERLVELGIIDRKWALSPRDDKVPAWDSVSNKEEWDLKMAVYTAMIDRMDQGIGRVLETLRKAGVEDNTLVLFLSDNGGCHEKVGHRDLNKPGTAPGERGSFVAYERNWANASNTPFRWFKHWVHEGGIATPFIAKWPERIRQHGTLRHEVAHITDITATCLDAAGAEYPSTFAGNAITPLVGKSLAPVFDGRSREPHARLYWEHEGNRAVREGKWKLVATLRGEWELYDLEADRTELHNRVKDDAATAERLNKAWEQWAAGCGVRDTPA